MNTCHLDEDISATPGDLMGYALPLHTRNPSSYDFAEERAGIVLRLGQVTQVNALGRVTSWRDHLGQLRNEIPAARWIAPLACLPRHLAMPLTPEYGQAMVELSDTYPTLQALQAYILRFRRHPL